MEPATESVTSAPLTGLFEAPSIAWPKIRPVPASRGLAGVPPGSRLPTPPSAAPPPPGPVVVKIVCRAARLPPNTKVSGESDASRREVRMRKLLLGSLDASPPGVSPRFLLRVWKRWLFSLHFERVVQPAVRAHLGPGAGRPASHDGDKRPESF